MWIIITVQASVDFRIFNEYVDSKLKILPPSWDICFNIFTFVNNNLEP